MCNSCEENSVASGKCEEFLCSDCVRAHQWVKMTKDHKIPLLQVSGQSVSLAHLNYCPIHRNEKLTLYCTERLVTSLIFGTVSCQNSVGITDTGTATRWRSRPRRTCLNHPGELNIGH